METNGKNNYLCELKLSYSIKVKPKNRKKISNSKDVFLVFNDIFDYNTLELREYFYLLCVNRANEVIGWHLISSGGVSGTVVDARLIFSIAIKSLASGIILAHNHPSGNLSPSSQDINLTKKIKEGGKLLDINVLDHIIYCDGEYYSFADNDIM